MSDHTRGLSAKQRSPAAQKQARYRDRKKAAETAVSITPLMYERADWQMFIQPSTLPQRAGCAPHQVGRIVLKELVDNGLDSGGAVTVERHETCYRIADTGPGIDPAQIPLLFAANRPLLSSKLKRLPLRGMLGNGLRVVMGAVAAYSGAISVSSRGRRLALAVDELTGETLVTKQTESDVTVGTVVEIMLPIFDGDERGFAERSLIIANAGETYRGASDPRWYDAAGFGELFARVVPADTTVAALVRDVFGADLDDDRLARTLSREDIAEIRDGLIAAAPPVPEERIGYVGDDLGGHHAKAYGIARIGDAEVPYCAEAWADCRHAEKGTDTDSAIVLWLNRSPTIAPLYYATGGDGMYVNGCGHEQAIPGAKRGDYTVALSLITPHVRLMNDGKTPFLGDFREGIARALQKASGAAYRAMVRPARRISIKDAAYDVMADAYMKASDGGKLPANARQIMYAARPRILELTGIEKLSDSYFTQALLPDYLADNPEQTADWDVVFDARGHFAEPHTGLSIPVGTLDVRSYLGHRPKIGPAVRLETDSRFPTNGPKHRFRNVLFIEKEGFDPLLDEARIAERFDIAILSTKGMSVTASRMLLDNLAADIDRVLVLHDFDVSGFTIAGTLGSDGRRYTYENAVEFVDLGLRLADAVGLQSEPVTIDGDWLARADTLRRHGATEGEIDYLLGTESQGARRVELNAMTSRQFLDFLEAKLSLYCDKVVPPADVIEQHARRLIETQHAAELLNAHRTALAEMTAARRLPDDLRQQVEHLLREQPTLPWDAALAHLLDPMLLPEG